MTRTALYVLSPVLILMLISGCAGTSAKEGEYVVYAVKGYNPENKKDRELGHFSTDSGARARRLLRNIDGVRKIRWNNKRTFFLVTAEPHVTRGDIRTVFEEIPDFQEPIRIKTINRVRTVSADNGES